MEKAIGKRNPNRGYTKEGKKNLQEQAAWKAKKEHELLYDVKTVYNLKLHERLLLPNGMEVLRVPGGWLYDCWNFNDDKPKTGTFVPYRHHNIEFTKEEMT